MTDAKSITLAGSSGHARMEPYTDATIRNGSVVLHRHTFENDWPWDGPYKLYRHATTPDLWSIRGPGISIWIEVVKPFSMKQLLEVPANLNIAYAAGAGADTKPEAKEESKEERAAQRVARGLCADPPNCKEPVLQGQGGRYCGKCGLVE